MEIILSYKYKSGQCLKYRQATHMILNELPEGAKQGPAKRAGRSTTMSTVRVISENQDGTWTLEMDNEPVAMEGILQNIVPAEMSIRGIRFTTDARGHVIQMAGQAPVPQIPPFPDTPLKEGDSWRSPEDPLGITFILRSIERKGDEVIAHLVSTSKSVDPREGIATDTDSTISFSVTAGYQLNSTTVIEMSWRDGKELSMVVESSLIEAR